MFFDDGVGVEDAVGLALPEAEGEAAGDSDEFNFPFPVGGFFEGQGRERSRYLGHDGHVMAEVLGFAGLMLKWIAAN